MRRLLKTNIETFIHEGEELDQTHRPSRIDLYVAKDIKILNQQTL